MDAQYNEILEKLRKYCAYQERSHHQVSERMWDLKVPTTMHDDILVTLIQEGFLNEERFARAYVRGKFGIKKWGRIKILHGLKKHRISKKCTQLALTEIDEDQYLKTLRDAVHIKNNQLKERNVWKRRRALYQFATGKGFETTLVNEVLDEVSIREK